MPTEKVLVVDDDSAIRYTLSEALRAWGYDPLEASTVAAALESFDAEQPLAVLQDINLPDGSGLEALIEYKKRQPQAIVIMITGNVQLEDTIAALRGGAYDFIGKPVRLGELQVTIRNGIEAARLRREVRLLRREQERRFSFEQIIGQSPAMTEMIRLARKVAASEASSVLLLGESGTGKDLVAKAVHYGSSRGDPGDLDRERIVRARERRFHRREGAQRRLVRAGARRHALPGRDRRARARVAGEIASGPGRGIVSPRRRVERFAARRASGRRFQSRPEGRKRRR